jgi:hemerythrin-like domain-containing protein
VTSPTPIDVRDMAIVHQAFRRSYNESATLVRSAVPSSQDRVRFLADHVELTSALLHLHHEGEDELLYPKLMERRPDQASSTEKIKHEHEDIQTKLRAVSDACSAWRAGPSTESGEALASALDELNAALQVHLDDEEQQVVPLAAVTLTQKEWDELGSHAVAQMAPKQRAIAFGILLEPLNEADRAYMKKNLPPPVRLLFPLLIQRPWTKYSTTLRSGS